MAEIDRALGGAVTRRHFLAAAAGLATGATLYRGDACAAAGSLMTRPIPRTGERLPAVGLGTAIVFDIGEDAPRRAERSLVIAALVESGARVIDTAPSYGTAESVVGDLVTALGARDRVFLATKVRVAPRAAATAEMHASLCRLKTGRIDLMQIHNAGADLGAMADQLALLREWKARGVFRYVGVTHSQESANERLVALVEREKLDFVQLNYSLGERGAEARLLPAAAASGTAVLVNLPFGRGRLFSAVRGRVLPQWAADFDAASWAQFFLKWILAHPAVTCAIPGTSKATHLEDNLQAGVGRLRDPATRRRMAEYLERL